MSERVQKLRDEVKNLASNWSQAAYEIEGLLLNTNTLLSFFAKSDWDELKIELPTWNNSELKILASTLSGGDVNGNIIQDNFFYGYIFTLVDDSTSVFLLNDMFYFLESNIDSEELLESMLLRLLSLKLNGFLTDDSFEYWKNRVEHQKASR